MRRFVTAAPHGEPPTTGPESTRPRALPIDLHARRPHPHRAQTPRLRDALDHPRTHPEPAVPQDDVAVRDCRRFAEIAIRSVLEVLDQRRQPAALGALLAPTPLALVSALARARDPRRKLGAAALHRLHVHAAGPGHAELFGSYVRGGRAFAIAGHLEKAAPARGRTRPAHTTAAHTADAGGGWVVSSLQIG